MLSSTTGHEGQCPHVFWLTCDWSSLLVNTSYVGNQLQIRQFLKWGVSLKLEGGQPLKPETTDISGWKQNLEKSQKWPQQKHKCTNKQMNAKFSCLYCISLRPTTNTYYRTHHCELYNPKCWIVFITFRLKQNPFYKKILTNRLSFSFSMFVFSLILI